MFYLDICDMLVCAWRSHCISVLFIVGICVPDGITVLLGVLAAPVVPHCLQ